jgi:hypothetical protein
MLSVFGKPQGRDTEQPGWNVRRPAWWMPLIEASLGIAVIMAFRVKPGGLNEVLKHFEMEDPAALRVGR